MAVAPAIPQCKNVELGGRDGLKTFQHGVCSYFIPKVTRINGGWWISIARHLRIFFCFTTLISDATKVVFAEAFQMLLKIHHMTRNPVFKTDINDYKKDHEEFLKMLVHICAPSTKTRCRSIKFHQPTHWYQTRIDLGCAAMEKSLEKMLGESQKKPSSLQTHASILRYIYALVCFHIVILLRIVVCFITFKYALTAHLMCIKNNFMILCMHIKCALYMHLYASDMFQLDMYVILCIFI